MKIGIIGSSKIKQSEFSEKYVPHIMDRMQDTNIQFIFTDEEIPVARYLNGRGFRNCVIYHTGNKPRHTIGHYPTKSFISHLEALSGIYDDAELLINP